tara:strand:- start:5610 stop:6170 length:561 start_codon:yes stop_codon:yes gene_type:complete
MIYFVDNFLSPSLLNNFLEDQSQFITFPTSGKTFWVRPSYEEFDNYVIERISKIEQRKIKNILSFFREAKEGQDDEWRIHNDSIINGEQPDRAIVLYMQSEESKELNGTAFWEHKKYGEVYKESGYQEDEKDLIEGSNKIEDFTLKSIIGYKQNRLLSYPSNYYHSKYPREFKEPRRVFVMFYKIL